MYGFERIVLKLIHSPIPDPGQML